MPWWLHHILDVCVWRSEIWDKSFFFFSSNVSWVFSILTTLFCSLVMWHCCSGAEGPSGMQLPFIRHGRWKEVLCNSPVNTKCDKSMVDLPLTWKQGFASIQGTLLHSWFSDFFMLHGLFEILLLDAPQTCKKHQKYARAHKNYGTPWMRMLLMVLVKPMSLLCLCLGVCGPLKGWHEHFHGSGMLTWISFSLGWEVWGLEVSTDIPCLWDLGRFQWFWWFQWYQLWKHKGQLWMCGRQYWH